MTPNEIWALPDVEDPSEMLVLLALASLGQRSKAWPRFEASWATIGRHARLSADQVKRHAKRLQKKRLVDFHHPGGGQVNEWDLTDLMIRLSRQAGRPTYITKRPWADKRPVRNAAGAPWSRFRKVTARTV